MALPLLVKAALIGAAAYAVARTVKSQQQAREVDFGSRVSSTPSIQEDEHPWPTSSAPLGPTTP